MFRQLGTSIIIRSANAILRDEISIGNRLAKENHSIKSYFAKVWNAKGWNFVRRQLRVGIFEIPTLRF